MVLLFSAPLISRAARLCDLFERQSLTAPLGADDQIKIALRRKKPPELPRLGRGIWHTHVGREVRIPWPETFEKLLHVHDSLNAHRISYVNAYRIMQAGMKTPMSAKANRLRQAREAAGFSSASEAAARFEWKGPTYLGHENGSRGYDDEMALIYARAFKVTPEWLLFGREMNGKHLVDTGEQRPAGFQLVSVYDIDASAGHGAIVTEEAPLYDLAFRRDWLKSITNASAQDLLVIRAKGDSMLPTITDGDTLLVDRTKININYDGIFILRYDDVLRVKRLDKNPATGLYRVKSDNPVYDTFDVRADHLDVIGRVIWIGRKV